MATTIVRLPRFADHEVAEALGYRSIGDGLTGYEHFVLWKAIDDDDERLVRGLTDSLGNCRPPMVKGRQVPMLHVWITPHRCGPFAALEGIAGGQVNTGETKLCDHAHGTP